MLLKLDARHHALGGLLVLESALVLPIALVPLLILQCEGGKMILPKCAGCLGHLGLDLYTKGGCTRIPSLRQLAMA